MATSPAEQLSVTVAAPSAARIAAGVGLHPRTRVVPVAVITGATRSDFQVTVRVTETAALPQASVTLKVRVWDFSQVPVTGPSVAMATSPVLQLSVTVAVPSAARIAASDGLHPRATGEPVATITGATRSDFQVTVRVTGTAALPQASVTLNVRV